MPDAKLSRRGGRRKTRVLVCGDDGLLAIVREGLRRKSILDVKCTTSDPAIVELNRISARRLADGGFEIHHARAPDECLEMAGDLRPHLLFLHARRSNRIAAGRVRWLLRAAPGSYVVVLVDEMTMEEKGRFIQADVYDAFRVGMEPARRRYRIGLIARLTFQERAVAHTEKRRKRA